MSDEAHYACPDCGGDNVLRSRWVNANTGDVEDEHNYDYFCDDCNHEVGYLFESEPPEWTVAHASHGESAFRAASPERAIAQYLLEGVPAKHLTGKFIVKRTDTDYPFDEVYEIESVEYQVKLRAVG